MRENVNVIEEKIKVFENELSTTKYNKRTQHHIGLVKAKIARLRDEQETRLSKGKKKIGFAIKKTGDATAAIVGYPSVGKSTLLNKLTNAESKTGYYPFTTLNCIPGMMFYKHARIQILDMPGVIRGASRGLGQGRESLSIIRNADLIILLIDDIKQLEIIKNELIAAGIRINQKRPDVKINITEKGGVRVLTTVKLNRIDNKTIEGVLKEYRVTNAVVIIRENIDIDDFIDVLEENRYHVGAIIVFNKIDMLDKEYLAKVRKTIPDAIFISAEKNINLDELKEAIFQKLKLIRVYLKEVTKKASMEEPLVLREGSKVKNICERLHRDFLNKFKYARIWGKSAKFPGQIQQLDHVLQDGDVVEIHLR